jgi:hypothetical protein
MSTKVTARFYVESIKDFGNNDFCLVKLQPAYGGGQNADWAKYTPSGNIELNIGAELPAAQFFRDLLRDKGRNIAVEFSVVDKGE